MALALTLEKENTFMGTKFEKAYWVIEDLRFTNVDGINMTSFYLNAYPSREASKMTGQNITKLSFGQSMRVQFDARLYEYTGLFKTEIIFPNGIPISESEQKKQIYPFIKAYLSEYKWEDVLEIEQ